MGTSDNSVKRKVRNAAEQPVSQCKMEDDVSYQRLLPLERDKTETRHLRKVRFNVEINRAVKKINSRPA